MRTEPASAAQTAQEAGPSGDRGPLPARPARPPAPRQLPRGLRHFAGRRREPGALTRLLAQTARPRGAPVIAAIGGTAGIGKTALAVWWAHQAAARFPGGQLFVNLRGFDPAGPPATAAAAIRCFLDAFGVPAGRVPATAEAPAALYRTLLAGKRVLVVLDNARDEAQARPLLPGSPGCLVLGKGPGTHLSPAEATSRQGHRINPHNAPQPANATDRFRCCPGPASYQRPASRVRQSWGHVREGVAVLAGDHGGVLAAAARDGQGVVHRRDGMPGAAAIPRNRIRVRRPLTVSRRACDQSRTDL